MLALRARCAAWLHRSFDLRAAGPPLSSGSIIGVALGLSFATLFVGCDRAFTALAPPTASTVLLPSGERCGDAGQCASQVCADGVCCGSACSQTEGCDLPGTVGTCAPRPLGTPCDAGAWCPSGNCVDGVCCESRCDSPCYTCAQPGDAGQCLPAADDTDPRDSCGFCSACFAGVCNPAIAGTDPHADCASTPGQTCAGGACAAQEGAACAGDADCAIGFCEGWECIDLSYFRIDPYPFLPVDQIRRPLAVTAGEQGASMLVVTLDALTPDGGPVGTLIALMAPDLAGPWSAQALDYLAPNPAVGAVAMIGDIAYFAVANGDGTQDDPPSPGIYLEAYSVAGTYVTYDPLAPTADYLASVNNLALVAQSDGQLLLGGTSPDAGLVVLLRGADSTWTGPTIIAATADGVAGATVDGEALLLYASQGEVHAVDITGADVVATGTPPGCSGPVALAAATAHETRGDLLSFVVTCAGTIEWGTYNPQLPDGGTQWTFTPAPSELPADVCLLATNCPVAQYVPVGGFGNALLYASFEAGQLNGFTSMFTVAADSLTAASDGGTYSGFASTPDTQFSFLSIVGTSNPAGDPVVLLGSAVVPDAGPPIDGELLIQDWFLFNP